MDTILMNSENREIPGPYGLLLNPSEKINLKRSANYVALSSLSSYYTWKNTKHTKTVNLKYQLPYSLNYLMDHILYQIFKTILSISSIMIYVNKLENRIMFKIKTILFSTFCVWNNEITRNL